MLLQVFPGGLRVLVCPDHKLLAFAFAKEADSWSAHQQRHLAYISEYTTAIEHVDCKDNAVTDAVSRIVIGSIHVQVGLDYHVMALP